MGSNPTVAFSFLYLTVFIVSSADIATHEKQTPKIKIPTIAAEVPFHSTRVIACKLLIGKLLASFSRLYFGGHVYIASHDFAWQRKVQPVVR